MLPEEFDTTRSFVYRFWTECQKIGVCSTRHVVDNLRSRTSQVVNQIFATTVKRISGKSVARRWQQGGLHK